MTSSIEDFSVASAVVRTGALSFEANIPDGWQQGRGAFGGLTLATITRAMEHVVDEPERALRSLTGALPAPVMTGPVKIEIEEVRKGSAVTTLNAKMFQADELVAVATGIFGKSRPVDLAWAPVSPEMPSYESARVVMIEPPSGPAFARHLEFRHTGPLPFSQHNEPIARGWIRTRRPLDVLGAPEVVAYADAWWPGLFAIESTPRPMGTLSYSLQIHARLDTLSPSDALFHRARAITAGEGYSIEHRELWSAGGDLIAMNQQTFAIIK